MVIAIHSLSWNSLIIEKRWVFSCLLEVLQFRDSLDRNLVNVPSFVVINEKSIFLRRDRRVYIYIYISYYKRGAIYMLMQIRFDFISAFRSPEIVDHN